MYDKKFYGKLFSFLCVTDGNVWNIFSIAHEFFVFLFIIVIIIYLFFWKFLTFLIERVSFDPLFGPFRDAFSHSSEPMVKCHFAISCNLSTITPNHLIFIKFYINNVKKAEKNASNEAITTFWIISGEALSSFKDKQDDWKVENFPIKNGIDNDKENVNNLLWTDWNKMCAKSVVKKKRSCYKFETTVIFTGYGVLKYRKKPKVFETKKYKFSFSPNFRSWNRSIYETDFRNSGQKKVHFRNTEIPFDAIGESS